MINSEISLDLSDHTSQFTNSLCNIFPDRVLSILSAVGPCTIGANLKPIFKDHADFKGCSGKKIFLNDLTNESFDHKGQMDSDVYKQRCGNFLSQPSVTTCDRHMKSFLQVFKRFFVDRKRKCLCRFVQKGIDFEKPGLTLTNGHAYPISFEHCQKLHLYFDRFLPCDLKVCSKCRRYIKNEIEKHEEMLNKPIAPPLSEMDTDEQDPSTSGLDLADLELNVDPDTDNSGDAAESSEEQYDSQDQDSDDSDDSSAPDKKKMEHVRNLLKACGKKGHIPRPLKRKQKVGNLGKSKKKRMNETITDTIVPLIEHFSPEKQEQAKIYQNWINSGLVEKKIGEDKVSDFLLRDIILSYNNADSRQRIRIVTILVRRYKYSYLKKFNPKWFKDDKELEDEIEDSEAESDETDKEEEDEEEDDDEDLAEYFDPPLTYKTWRNAQFLYGEYGHPMADAPIHKRCVWRIDPHVINTICDYVMGDKVTNKMAHGTYVIRDGNNSKVIIAKTIRETHNAELIRQINSLLKENGMVPPGESTLKKILSIMKATGGREMRGINSILEEERRAITLLADNLQKLEKILIEKEDNSKKDIITELSKDITIIGDYLKNHFVYNLSLDNEDVNHCCRFACSDSKFVDGYGIHPFKSECKNHSHEELDGDCQYCNLIPHVFEEFRDLLAYSNDYMAKIDHEEMAYELDNCEENIKEYQHMMKRNFIQSMKWEALFEEHDETKAMVTSDFAM